MEIGDNNETHSKIAKICLINFLFAFQNHNSRFCLINSSLIVIFKNKEKKSTLQVNYKIHHPKEFLLSFIRKQIESSIGNINL